MNDRINVHEFQAVCQPDDFRILILEDYQHPVKILISQHGLPDSVDDNVIINTGDTDEINLKIYKIKKVLTYTELLQDCPSHSLKIRWAVQIIPSNILDTYKRCNKYSAQCYQYLQDQVRNKIEQDLRNRYGLSDDADLTRIVPIDNPNNGDSQHDLGDDVDTDKVRDTPKSRWAIETNL